MSASALLHLVPLIARQDPGTGDGSAAPDSSSSDGQQADADPCASTNYNDKMGLRIGAIFVILVTSAVGTFTPIVLRSVRTIPRSVWEFAKFFGSGVIIATAFIHLLAPSWDELTSDCLVATYPVFGLYDWAPAISMIAVYFIFITETIAYRIGTAKLEKLGILMAHGEDQNHTTHTHSHVPVNQNDNEAIIEGSERTKELSGESSSNEGISKKDSDVASVDLEVQTGAGAVKQLIGVAILEFGVVLHSIIIGLTLAVNQDFIVLFIVIIFHQMFEGLGLGSRLAVLNLPKKYSWTRYAAAGLYCICTPIGMAAGLGAIQSFNGNGAAANLATGVLDGFSSGILLYTGLVELIAHEILFNPRMMSASPVKMTYALGCMILGSGLMALLGRWA